MPAADNSAPRAAPQLPGWPLPDLALYERLIGDGIAAAQARRSAVDHLTARRLAIWLAARPQPPVFARGLAHFAETGAISRALRTQLRIHARGGGYPGQITQAAWLLRYCTARGDDLGPLDKDFGAACDQIDRSDAMLAELHDGPGQGWPDAQGPPVIARARRDPGSHLVCLILDATTASTAIFAITAHADEREAHIREVEYYSQSLPEGSYGRANRQAIAARETRIAARLRAIERAYRTATEHDTTPKSPEPTAVPSSPQRPADREIELE